MTDMSFVDGASDTISLCSSDGQSEDLLGLHARIDALELETKRLLNLVATQRTLIEQLQDTLLNVGNNGVGMGMKKHNKPKDPVMVAKTRFYNEHKKDLNILAPLRSKLQSVNMVWDDDQKIPWQLIKYETDKLFEKMDHCEKAKYLPEST